MPKPAPRAATRVPARHRRALFAKEYLVDRNAGKAAVRAGFSERSARSIGQRLLLDPGVQAIIQEGQAKLLSSLDVTAERVVRELAAIAFADIGDTIVVQADGAVRLRPLDTIRPEARRAIGEITQHTTESSVDGQRVVEKVRTTIKHHSKVAALVKLADHLGLDAPKRREHSGPGGGPIQAQLANLSTEELVALLEKTDEQ